MPKWIDDAYAQAELEKEHRVPIVVLHRKGEKYDDCYVLMKLIDFKEIFNE